jgi:integrase
MVKSTTTKRGRKSKPQKPRRDFPLFPHARGYWAKKVRGKLIYFGRIAADPQGEAALNTWLAQRDDLLAGRTPRANRDGFTVEDLADHFLNAKRPLVTSGELTKRTFDEYFATCERLIKTFGLTRLVDDLRPEDFDKLRAQIAKQWGPVRLGNEIQRIRTVFKFGFDAGLIDRPVRFGPIFKRPSKKVLRITRAEKGPRMFEADQIRQILAAAHRQFKAMLMLGINCGFGNADVAMLPSSALDLDNGWVNFPRPKTGIPRRCKLWQETIEAIREALVKRQTPKHDEDKGLVFITKRGICWAKETRDNPVAKEMAKLLGELGIKRLGLGFYGLRHTFETVAGESRDQVAVDHIMGHARDDMATVYRERISDERLEAVTEHVRKWLNLPTRKETKSERPAPLVVSA